MSSSESSSKRPPTSGSWKPGQSANPGGRSKEAREREKRVAAVVLAMGGEDCYDYFKILDSIARSDAEAAKDRIAAVKELLQRALGKAPDVVQLEGDGISGFQAALLAVAGMTPHERRKAESELDSETDDSEPDGDGNEG